MSDLAANKIFIGFNVTDKYLEHKYLWEVIDVRSRMMEEYATAHVFCGNGGDELSASKIHNTLYSTEVLMPIISFQNCFIKIKGADVDHA